MGGAYEGWAGDVFRAPGLGVGPLGVDKGRGLTWSL